MRVKFFSLLLVACLLVHQLQALIDGDLTQVVSVKEGQELLLKFKLAHAEKDPLDVNISLSDYTFNADGENYFLDAGSTERSCANWIDLPQTQFSVLPGEKKDVFYRVKVPDRLPKEGSYWCLFFVEPKNPIQPQSGDGFNFIVKIRYAYLLVLNVGNGQEDLCVSVRQLSQEENKRIFYFDLENRGNGFVKPKVQLFIYDSQGSLVKKENFPEEKILPTTSVRYRTDLTHAQAGPLTGMILMTGNQKKTSIDRFKFDVKD